ncbi:ABC transporter permease [Nonomuraea roseoviolacea]|uniref:Peptide/nickel transport system permease protein n=1 Tax=Nonomuraea roseoviolacea subsp. carminata TaxID=160689 RepID=A0ABT1KCC2_9ACTN|nr:ABC transporter permease [Nonomuraea roseoviolacea]MCP2351659.1 peptide/nickel transport system permease protein [Nonomuraea roseoviolacea subsp. carminata]
MRVAAREVAATTPRAARSPGRLALARLREDRPAMAGLVVVLTLVLLAALAPVITAWTGWAPETFDKTAIDPNMGGLPKGAWGGIDTEHLLGVEPVTGRDVLSRILYGGRISLLIAMLATAITVVTGLVLGLLAGFLGGWADTMISRITDLLMSFPSLIFMIAILSVVRDVNRIVLLVAVLSIFGWTVVARIVRGQVLTIKHREYVEAARVGGGMTGYILVKEILPGLTAPILVYATQAVPAYVGAEAALSFLGVGVRPPTPSWGQMINNARGWFMTDPVYLAVPCAFLGLTVLACTLLGDGLRDAFDPKAVRS